MCCLFGLIDYRGNLSGAQKSRIINALSRQCEVRGTDATGIAYNTEKELCIYKRPRPAHAMHFWIPREAKAIMGHTRMTTQGKASFNPNNHPFAGSCDNGPFALAHNGVLWNDRELKQSHHLPASRIETDSFVAVQLLEQQKTLDFSSMRKMAEALEGSFTFTILDRQNNLFIIKGDNPLCLYQFPKNGFYVYTSTQTILDQALRTLKLNRLSHRKISLVPGDLMKIDALGNREQGAFQPSFYRYKRYGACYYDFLFNELNEDVEDSEYLETLKSVAGAFGYTSEDIDNLRKEGFSLEEIEEGLYC